MPNLPVKSREYKLILNPDRFREREAGLGLFFKFIRPLIEKEGGKCDDKQPEEERRLTSYLDTPELAFSQNGFILRQRDGIVPANGFQVDLKYRSPDRYMSADSDVSTSAEGETEFEEDVLPPFTSKFSHSTKVPMTEKPDLDTVGKVVELFPGLAKLGLSTSTPVKKVNDFQAIEVVRKFLKFKFAGQKSVKGSLNFWYLNDTETEWPLIAEFSFKYDATGNSTSDKLEEFPIETVEGAGRFFRSLQKYQGWLSPGGTTKTAFALEA